MIMTREEIINFLNANPTCYLATVEGDAPHVRAIGIYKADERGILIQTGSPRGMYRELLANPRVELCFPGEGKVVRVSGTADFIEDQALKEEIINTRPFLKPHIEAMGWDIIKVFRVANPVATVWTIETNMDPREFIKL